MVLYCRITPKPLYNVNRFSSKYYVGLCWSMRVHAWLGCRLLVAMTSHKWASAAGGTAVVVVVVRRRTSVHAATTPKHNSSSYKAQEATARPHGDRPSEKIGPGGSVQRPETPVHSCRRGRRHLGPGAASALQSCRRSGQPDCRAFHQSLTLNI